MILQVILEPIFTIFFVGIGYAIGFVPVVVVSLTHLEPGPLTKAGDYKFYRSKGLRWWHLTYMDDGRRIVPAESVALIGWLILVCLFLSFWWLFHMLGF